MAKVQCRFCEHIAMDIHQPVAWEKLAEHVQEKHQDELNKEALARRRSAPVTDLEAYRQKRHGGTR